MGLKFVHMADIHLDTPFYSSDKNTGKLLKDSIKNAFAAGIELAVQQEVDAVLISGDLFDNNTLSFATEKFLLDQLDKLKDENIITFYSPGNHDPYGQSYKMRNIQWPSNIIIFDDDMPVTHQIKDKSGKVIGLVTGVGHSHKKEFQNLIKRFPDRDSQDIPHVGIAHVLVTGQKSSDQHERYAPCSISDMMEKGYDYWALGHVHTRLEISRNPFIIYPGNISGRNPVERGWKGAYLVDIDDNRMVHTDFHPLSPVLWEVVTIDDLEKIETLSQLENHIRDSLQDVVDMYDSAQHLFLRINLEGPCSLHEELKDRDNLESLCDYVKLFTDAQYVEFLVDRLTPSIDVSQFIGQPHLLGTVLDLLKDAESDHSLLLKLKPDDLGGCPSTDDDSVIEYLRQLMKGLDYEIASRMVLEDEL
ncbi:MAG: DNA repair exonuclease [Clostridia bacterium]|nr:DNA repair exonuclease [Clostridia bacterium]